MTTDDKIPKLSEMVGRACDVWITRGYDGQRMTEDQREEYDRLAELARQKRLFLHGLLPTPKAMCGCSPGVIHYPHKETWDRWLEAARELLEKP